MEFYAVSSFTKNPFGGNPAGVCILEERWPEDARLKAIAAQVNLSETAYVLEKDDMLQIRWFTPTVEVDLCGHATLAAAHVMFMRCGSENLVFTSGHHTLPVEKDGEMIVLDFPMAEISQLEIDEVPSCFDVKPIEAWTGHDEYMLVFGAREEVQSAVCDLNAASNINLSGFVITAAGEEAGVDFVSRYFGPKIGINEDPVTGSAHTLLVPYWRRVLGKDKMRAMQLSKRGGELHLEATGNRVRIGGHAVIYLKGRFIA